MKITDREAAARIVHAADQPDLPSGVVAFLSKSAETLVGPGFNGHHDEQAVNVAVEKVRQGALKYRELTKAASFSFGTDVGPAEEIPTIGDFRILWEEPEPETFTIAIAVLTQSLQDRGHTMAEAVQTANRVVKEMPPPTDPSKLGLYRDRAFRHALKVSDRERTIKRQWDGF